MDEAKRTHSVKSLSIVSLVVGYGACSSLLSIINKWAISVFGYPGLLTALQYVSCVVVVLTLGKLKLLEHDPLRLSTMVAFFPPALVFYLAIFTNTSLLKYANVDTFVMFRSSTPILVAIADTVFRKQPWPKFSTLCSLIIILLGAVGYVATDSQFTLMAYSWAFAYLTVITFEMVYVKHVISHMGLSTWGLVLYNNLLSLMLFPIFWVITGEFKETSTADYSTWFEIGVVLPVSLSCLFGLAISFFGFACRRAISATAFTVVGVTNKLLTIIINVLVWDRHASMTGIMFLLLTIVGGVAYQQSFKGGQSFRPVRSSRQTPVHDAESGSAAKTPSNSAVDEVSAKNGVEGKKK